MGDAWGRSQRAIRERRGARARACVCEREMGAEAGESVKVLNTWRSVFGLRVLIALQEKGVAYEYQEEDLPSHKSQLLLESNPEYKKIPVLLHKGRPVCESLIIVQYIDETWPSPQPFLPSDPLPRAHARFWADYVDKKFFEAAFLTLYNVEGDLMEKGRRDLIECMGTLDEALRDIFGGGPYFGGDRINFVDIAFAPYAHYFATLEAIGNFKLLDETKYPHLHAWATLIVEYPSVKEALSIAPPTKILESFILLRKEYLGV